VTAASLFGRPLPDGGTIGVAAPASPYESRSDVLRSVQWWESRGYRVKLAEHVFARDDYVAGDARDRAADLCGLFSDPEVDVVQCLQGGYGSAQIVPHLDFDAIAASPKPLVGFSDITALHVALLSRTGLATFYGNGFLGVGDRETTDFSRERLLAVLRGGGAGEVPRDPDDPFVRTIRGGTAAGPLVGGCLTLLMQTLGTPWEVDLEGSIFFFEDVELPPYQADGFLTQLGQAGKLAGVRGVVVGEMAKCDWRDHPHDWARTRTLEDLLEVHLEPLGVPVLYKLPLGHGKHLATIPLGVSATLDADAGTLTIEAPGLQGEREN
jgi:muramoyltetrapeptide carboxypeptidase